VGTTSRLRQIDAAAARRLDGDRRRALLCFAVLLGSRQASMGNSRTQLRIKGLSHDGMERLKRFTRALNAELALLGAEPIDLLEAHAEYQARIDDHEGTWADLVRKIAAERTAERYVEEDEETDEMLEAFDPDELDQEGPEAAK
jgi:hypothetical protein